jgi:hypothetical protein
MELADPELVASLRAGPPHPRKTHHAPWIGSRYFIYPRPKRRMRPMYNLHRKCTVGAIFNAKFADPNYYRQKPMGVGSPLGWLR